MYPIRWTEPLLRRYLTPLYPDHGNHYTSYDFEWIVGWMSRLAWYESRGKWNAVNRVVYTDPWRQASGVFQHLPRYWSALSQLDEGSPVRGAPGRCELTVAALTGEGLWEPWMDTAALHPLPAGVRMGILDPSANVAVAVWLFGQQGPLAWSPAKSLWPPEAYEIG